MSLAPAPRWALSTVFLSTLAAWGCASDPTAERAAPPATRNGPAGDTVPRENGRPPSESDLPADSVRHAPEGEEGEPGLLELCRTAPAPDTGVVDQARRRLEETFCGATLWFDGLFGGEPDVANARRTSGRVELSAVHSEFHGLDLDGRFRLRYELPTLEDRVNVFLGRSDRDAFIEDREEGLAARSTLDERGDETWLTGLGYTPPGPFGRDLDLRVGVRPRISPELFAQTRFRRNVRVTDVSAWRLRETLFWENRRGFGSTTSIGYDRVLRTNLLVHWNTSVTISEASAGLAWRSTGIVYHNLGGQQAVAGEAFLRGATSAPIPVREYGLRGIYRQPLSPYLFGEVVAGYSWPRERWDETRDAAWILGLGAELFFGILPE